MPSVIATDSTRRFSIQYLPGGAGVGTDLTMIHFPVAQLFHLCILGWHDANGDLRCLAEVRTIECNRRNRPTPQSLPGFLAQALEEPIFHHIASLSEASVHDRCRSLAPLFDHLVGAGEHGCRHIEAERFRGLEIDDQFVLGRRLHRQVGRLLALEDAVDVSSRAPKLVEEIRAIGNQAAGGDEVAFIVDTGQPVAGGQRDDRSRCTAAAGLAVTIRPLFAERAKVAMARSISATSRTLTGLTSTLNAGATAWMAPS